MNVATKLVIIFIYQPYLIEKYYNYDKFSGKIFVTKKNLMFFCNFDVD